MKLDISPERQAIIDQAGHLLVCGGPGSGKTTIALLKAKQKCGSLLPGQNVLFLSFSRAAVRQVVTRCKPILSMQERRLIEVRTYHAFCMEVLQSHGMLITGHQCKFVTPANELIQKSTFESDWDSECKRRASEDGSFCFDLFAWGVATLFERSRAIRDLYGSKYPLVVIDEFQDTDDDQWRIVLSLAKVSDVFCLADPEQRIFDYRPSVNPKRLDQLRELVKPMERNLGRENHRSPDADILDFADAVLYNRSPLPISNDVKFVYYYGRAFEALLHAAVIWTFSQLRERGAHRPSVAVLCRSNYLVAKVSQILSEPHVYKGRTLAPVDHDVVWDADLSAASAVIVGSIMEWPTLAPQTAVCRTLALIAHYFRLRNAASPSQTAAVMAGKFCAVVERIGAGAEPKNKAAKQLVDCCRGGIHMTGDPIEDWKSARKVLEQAADFASLSRDARTVRLFGARDALVAGLGSTWLSSGSYAGAGALVRKILDQERLLSTDRDPRGCMLMNMHKSKGKEFDGVVLVEGEYASPFLDREREKFPFEKSRRLFRVAATRAKSMVLIVRPKNAPSLVGPN